MDNEALAYCRSLSMGVFPLARGLMLVLFGDPAMGPFVSVSHDRQQPGPENFRPRL
jgi:hypothetical protein